MDVFYQYSKVSAKEFQRLAGVNKAAFNIMLQKFKDEKAKYLAERPMRSRGRKQNMSDENQLLMYLLYLRNYHTYLNLGKQFGFCESYTYKVCQFTKKMLLRCMDIPSEESLKTTLETNLVAVDVSEQEIERPIESQEIYYSGKKRDIQ
jgi:hypothetical protein